MNIKFNWLTGSGGNGAKCISIFRQNLSIVAGILRFFKTIAAAFLDFRNSQILLADGFRRAKMHHHAKFCQNPSIHCGVIAIFRFFKTVTAPSWIFKILHFYWQIRSGGQDASLCQIVSKSVERFLRYHNFLFFKMVAAIISDFRNSQILLVQGSGGPRCITVPNFIKTVNPLRRYSNFSIFQNGSHLPSWICLGHIWITHTGYSAVFNTVQISLQLMQQFQKIWKSEFFTRLARKRLLVQPKIGFWGNLTP